MKIVHSHHSLVISRICGQGLDGVEAPFSPVFVSGFLFNMPVENNCRKMKPASITLTFLSGGSMFYVVNCARLFVAELPTVKQVTARVNTLGERERHPF
jgi:hypothetical protein